MTAAARGQIPGLLGREMKDFYLQVAAAAIFLSANAAVYVFRIGGAPGLGIISNLSAILASLVAVFACVCALRSFIPGDKRRKGWLLWGLGFSLYFWGELIWGIYELFLRKPLPFPSAADAFWLIGYIPLFLGLLSGYRFSVGRLEQKHVYVMWFLLTIVILLLMAFLFIPIIRSPQTPWMAKILDLAYPAGDLILLTPTLVIALSLRGNLLGKPWFYICLGFVCLSAADSVFSYLTWNNLYRTGSLVDLLWLAGYLLIALGASYQVTVNKVGY